MKGSFLGFSACPCSLLNFHVRGPGKKGVYRHVWETWKCKQEGAETVAEASAVMAITLFMIFLNNKHSWNLAKKKKKIRYTITYNVFFFKLRRSLILQSKY